ncbi:MAG: Atrazine chlorohydrolase [Candidatus Heimdallarchaeota archaeon LC_2]|nr:MAG: Atrazine chlorohydrolase [Candidatus Heimdallarchaeota archaeon LC_2]
MSEEVLFVRARFLLPMTKTDGKLDRIEDGYILAGKSIKEIGQYSDEIGKRIIEDYGSNLKVLGNPRDVVRFMDLEMQNGVILPGFVKGHGHDHESVLIGLARDLPLTDWLDEAINIFTGFLHENQDSLTHEFGKSPYYIAYIKARLDDISFGITSALTHHCNFNKYHVDELVAANENAGTRIFIAVGSQDRHYDSRILDTPEEAIERMNLLETKHGHLDRTTIIPGPDQLFSNGPELLKALKKWANDHNKLLHIHSSEEPATTKWFTEEYGMTPIEYADSIQFLDDRTMLAHQVNNTDHDLDLIQNSGAMVVHNPLANTILGSGMPPVLEMIKRNIPICFSTDGSGSADNQNMLSAARLASQYQKAFHQDAKVLNAEESLSRITSHPAKILRLNAGTLEVGKDSDFLLFDLSKPNVTPTRLETVVENLIWASAGNEIKHVVANGQILVENYEFKTLDLNEVLTDIQNLADSFEIYKAEIKTKSETGVRSN